VLRVGDTALFVLLDARPRARRFQSTGAAARRLALHESDRELEAGRAESVLCHDDIQLIGATGKVLLRKAGDAEDRSDA
jgi:hypothetical protein